MTHPALAFLIALVSPALVAVTSAATSPLAPPAAASVGSDIARLSPPKRLDPNSLGPKLVIDGLAGPVTPHEIDAFKAFMRAQNPPDTPWGASHNAWAFYEGGPELESVCLMYELTGDTDFLDFAVRWADRCISERNDLLPASEGGQRVLWTGQIEKTWCPQPPNSRGRFYSGCESEDGIAHVAYCAKLILQHRELWSRPVPIADRFHFGATYLDRAKTYLAKCDEANESYFLKWFVEPGTNLIRPPKDSRWKTLGGDNNVTAINRQMMFDGGYQRLAECHELLRDDPERVRRYDAVVKASVAECLEGIQRPHPRVVDGHPVYGWSYYPKKEMDWTPSDRSESVGHAAYDVIGIYRAYHRPTYGLKLEDVVPIANTLVYVIAKPDGHFAKMVDGSGDAPCRYPEWVLAAEWNPDVYPTIGRAALATNDYSVEPWFVAAMLWEKHRRAPSAP